MRLLRSLLVVPLASACGSPSPATKASDSAPVATAAIETSAPDTGCRKTGLWQGCSVEDRLTRAGIVIEAEPAPVERDLFSVPGAGYKVGGGDDRLEVFVYPSAEARRADTDKLDSALVSPRGERRSYRVSPLLVTSNNLAALVFTLNERSQERLSLALSAGLPPR